MQVSGLLHTHASTASVAFLLANVGHNAKITQSPYVTIVSIIAVPITVILLGIFPGRGPVRPCGRTGPSCWALGRLDDSPGRAWAQRSVPAIELSRRSTQRGGWFMAKASGLAQPPARAVTCWRGVSSRTASVGLDRAAARGECRGSTHSRGVRGHPGSRHHRVLSA